MIMGAKSKLSLFARADGGVESWAPSCPFSHALMEALQVWAPSCDDQESKWLEPNVFEPKWLRKFGRNLLPTRAWTPGPKLGPRSRLPGLRAVGAGSGSRAWPPGFWLSVPEPWARGPGLGPGASGDRSPKS